MFPAESEEQRPEDVSEQGGYQQPDERGARGKTFRTKADGEVPKEDLGLQLQDNQCPAGEGQSVGTGKLFRPVMRVTGSGCISAYSHAAGDS